MDKEKIEFHHNDDNKECPDYNDMMVWIADQDRKDAKMRASGETQKVIDECFKENLKYLT